MEFSANSSVDIPLTPVDHPEVIEHDTRLGTFTSRPESSFWFMVPEGVESFGLEFPIGGTTGRISVWDPDGEAAWELNHHPSGYEGPDPAVVEIETAPDQQGRLWRITIPGSSQGFVMDERIPQVFTTTPRRWFEGDKESNDN